MQQTERFTRESRDQQTDRLKTMRTVTNDQKMKKKKSPRKAVMNRIYMGQSE